MPLSFVTTQAILQNRYKQIRKLTSDTEIDSILMLDNIILALIK